MQKTGRECSLRSEWMTKESGKKERQKETPRRERKAEPKMGKEKRKKQKRNTRGKVGTGDFLSS